jgi:hypothetical protein
MPSAMLTYLLAAIPPGVSAYLGTPTDTTLAPVLADAIKQYDPTFTLEAQCTDKVRFNAIGRALFWQYALEYMLAGKYTGQPGSPSEYAAHLAEVTRLRDYYASKVPDVYGTVGTVVFEDDPYAYPRFADR